MFDTSRVFEADFHYDFFALEKADFKSLPDEFQKPEGLPVSFLHTPEQKKIIDAALNIYGRDVVGVSRVLTKIYFSQIYRALAPRNP